ncbi:MAG: gamma-glutamyl-gamma-aminobutyrate hydrolase family protein [Bacteroidota bacterium]
MQHNDIINSPHAKQEVIFIGITETEALYDNYPVWIKGNDRTIEILKLTSKNFDEIDKCSGIVLSGGIDIHPKLYGNKKLNYPNAPETFNEERDEFEIKVFHTSQKIGLPLLAICRGMQLVNACLGGTLLQDLEESNKSNHRKQHAIDSIHGITIERNSFLFSICNTTTETINSAHHQGIDLLAPGLRVSAWSSDGVAEVLERIDAHNHPFFLGVQGHPERFGKIQPNNILINTIRLQFIEAAKNYILCKS